MERVFDESEMALIRENLIVAHAPEIDEGEPLNLSLHMKFFETQARAAFNGEGPEVIVIDTASQAFTIRSESDNSEIQQLMKMLVRLARRLNCVIVVVHHIGKAKSEDGQVREAAHRGRGASSFADMATAVFNLECDPQHPELVKLHCGKRKSGQDYEIAMHLDRETRWFSATGDEAPKPITKRAMVLDVLRQHGELKTAGVSQALEGKMSDRTVRSILTGLVTDGLVTQPTYGHWRIREQEKPQLGKAGNANKGLPSCQVVPPGDEGRDYAKDSGNSELGKVGSTLYELPSLPSGESAYREPTKEELAAAAKDPDEWRRLEEAEREAVTA